MYLSLHSLVLTSDKLALSVDPYLVWNYGSMAVIAFVAGILVAWHYRSLDAAEDELNELDAGHLETEKT